MTPRPLSAEHQSVRETLIGDAIAAGKFPESRAQFWRDQFDTDPEATKHWLARLEPLPNLAATAPRPTAAQPEAGTYDQSWLAPGERERITAAASTQRSRLAMHARD
jgi:hypothetical protein